MFPPRVVLAAVDFSDPSRTALVFAARLARHAGAALHVLHVEDPLLAEAARQSGFDLSQDARQELDRFLVTAPPTPGLSPRQHVITGSAADGILRVARQQHVDLVVVGSHGMSGASRALFGSVTEGVLHKANVAVLVTPATWQSPSADGTDLAGIGPIVAGVALSPSSGASARAACRLAATLGTTVEMVHVVPGVNVLSRWRAHAEAAMQSRESTARAALEAFAREAPCEVALQTRVEVGDVPQVLANAASPSATRHPILVLGRLPSGEGTPGAIAYRVLTLANVPVLMYVNNERSA